MLDGVTLFQARLRGMRTRHQVNERQNVRTVLLLFLRGLIPCLRARLGSAPASGRGFMFQ